MAFMQASLAKNLGVDPTKTRVTPISQKDSAVVATAGTFDFDIPRNKYLWSILIAIGENTTAVGGQGTLADDLVSLQLIGNGNKYMKDFSLADMVKEICKVNLEPQSTGYYKLYLKDPKLDGSRPLPTWLFTSLILRIVDNAPAASNYHHIRVWITESDYLGEDLTHHPVLIEKGGTPWRKFGTNTGKQEFEHERAYKVFGILYCLDDNGTLSDTIFDTLSIKGISPQGEIRPVEEQQLAAIKEMNKQEYLAQAMATGFFMVEFPIPLETSSFTSLKSYLNVPTAGTNVGIRTVERYVLS